MEEWKECMESCAVTRRFLRYHTTGGKVIMEASLSLLSDKLNKILLWQCNATGTAFY